MLISHLLKQRLANIHMSSYQILRVFLHFVGEFHNSDWDVVVIYIYKTLVCVEGGEGLFYRVDV